MVLAITVFCGLLLPAVAQAASAGDGDRRDLRITALIQSLSVQEALEAVALLADRPIAVMGPIEDREVSVNLREATLAESIEKVLSPSNYVIVWSDEESLVVLMLDGIGDPAVAASDSPAGSRENSDHGLVSIFWDGPEVLPPSHPGGEGLTMADIEYYWSFATDPDPSEVPVFPPSSADEIGFTEQDLANLLADPEPYLPADTNLVPPDDEWHSVITLQDVENLRSAMLGQQPSEVALWPADETGDSSFAFTVPRELLIPNGQDDILPENLADLIPPE